MSRKQIIAGNWKMNNTVAEGQKLVTELMSIIDNPKKREVIVCVPFTCLKDVKKLLKGRKIKLGAQNVHFKKSGAFTGEISADMLSEIGVQYVIVGHSERRSMFGDTDETVALRAKAALDAGIIPIVCVGETLEEREGNKTEEVLKRQTLAAFKDLNGDELIDKLVIAYEPVWAIGTGKVATLQQANDTIGFIRKIIKENVGKKLAGKIQILYGGSMNAKNAAELLSASEIDGGLIGGASLKAVDFNEIVKA